MFMRDGFHLSAERLDYFLDWPLDVFKSDRFFFYDGLVVPLPMRFPVACSEYCRLSISSFSCRLVFGCGLHDFG